MSSAPQKIENRHCSMKYERETMQRPVTMPSCIYYELALVVDSVRERVSVRIRPR